MMTYTRRRPCTRCHTPFAVDPNRPNARICVPCAEKHPDHRVRNRPTAPPKPVVCVPRGPSTPGQYSARTLLTPPGEWVSQARCNPDVAEMFWPLQGQSGGPIVEAALKVCSRCPVVRECGQWAIDNNQTEGIWGGMRPGALQRLVAKQRAGRTVEPPPPPKPKASYKRRDTCRRKHPLTDDNVRLDGRGHQVCKACDALRERRRRARLRGAEVPVC